MYVMYVCRLQIMHINFLPYSWFFSPSGLQGWLLSTEKEVGRVVSAAKKRAGTLMCSWTTDSEVHS